MRAPTYARPGEATISYLPEGGSPDGPASGRVIPLIQAETDSRPFKDTKGGRDEGA